MASPDATPSEGSMSEQGGKVSSYYGYATQTFYLDAWHPDHLHFGIFEPGECPEGGESMAESSGFTRALERTIDLIVAPIGIEEGQHVVDCGCGVGGTAIYLAEKLGCTVTGVNITEPQLEMAREKVAGAGLGDRIDFKWADCSRHLPFDDESVDAVVNVETACHYSDRDQYLHEVCRILKPGGRTGAMDWMTPDDLSAGQYEEHIQPVCDAWMVHSLESEATYTEKLSEAGLEVVEFEGFDGKDEDNLKLLDRNYQLLGIMLLSGFGAKGSSIHKSMLSIDALRTAWREGHFVLKRYCAKKPEEA